MLLHARQKLKRQKLRMAASLQTYLKMNLRKYRELVTGITVVVVLFEFWMWDTGKGRNDNRIKNQNELTELRATLANKPSIETAEQGGLWVPISLNEFPTLKFDVGGSSYSALKAKEFVSEVSIGDTLFLSILTYDYETKIKKEKSLRPSETAINHKFIEPYSIQCNNKIYMSLAAVNSAWQDNHDSSIWLLYRTLGTVAFAGLVY